MPGSVKPAQPTDVMPYALAQAFSEELRLEALVNSYPDGQSDRSALQLTPRRFFRLTYPLTASQWTAMFNFYKNHIALPFYFYSLRETSPPWTWDASGASTFGRYTVVFDGPWIENTALARAQISFNLREVA